MNKLNKYTIILIKILIVRICCNNWRDIQGGPSDKTVNDKPRRNSLPSDTHHCYKHRHICKSKGQHLEISTFRLHQLPPESVKI